MTAQELELAKLHEIASEYQAKGYTVSVHPGPSDLPAFLAPFDVDLVAQSPNDNVVVEVSSGPSIARDVLVRVAEAVKSQPTWRLELAVVNPPAAPDVPLHAELADEEQIRTSLRNAQILEQAGQHEAAALLAWAAAEGILRTWAQSDGLDIERKSSSALLKNLYSMGRLDPSAFAKLQTLLEFRNAYAHGFRAHMDREKIEELIGEVSRLSNAA